MIVPIQGYNTAMSPVVINQESGEEATYDDALYAHGGHPEAVTGFDAVDAAAVARFETEGYLLIRGAFTRQELAQAGEGLEDMIQERTGGSYELNFERHAGDLGGLSPAQRSAAVRKVFQYHGVDARCDAMIHHPKLRALLERLGFVRPHVLQTMALLKGPGGREKAWHQDKAYFNLRTEERAVGAWIALDPATIENGCMHILPGMHHTPRIHFHRRDWQICDTDIASLGVTCLAVEMAPGDLLMFDSMLPHGTPRNTTRRRRRALQCHYLAGDTQLGDDRDRFANFGNAGKDVTC